MCGAEATVAKTTRSLERISPSALSCTAIAAPLAERSR
jgi:hypothetical protein